MMHTMRRWAFLAAALLPALFPSTNAPNAVCRADDAQALVDLGLAPVQTRTLGEHPGHKGHVHQSRDATFLLTDTYYTIRYCACVDKAHDGKAVPLEGYIGMPEPCACNWYHSGFLAILVNGRDIGTAPLAGMTIAESGNRAILDMVWLADAGAVRARFLGLPHRDGLYCEVTVDPKEEVKSLAARLTCYPSFFTSAYHRDGARRIQTPNTLVRQGERVNLPAKDHWWSVYYDEIFDVAKGEGDGPCALLVLPEQVTEIGFEPGGYAVGTRITCAAGATRVRLALWDFKGKSNAQAVERLRTIAPQIRRELTALDFTPAAVKGFDLSAIRDELQRAVKSPAVRTALGKKTAEIEDWLRQYASGKEPGKRPSGIEAEQRLLQSIDKYQRFSWEVKLAELLSKL